MQDVLNGSLTDVARAKFLGEAALIARALHLIGSSRESDLRALVSVLERELNSWHQISLADNSLRVADLLYPYAALRDYITAIPFYETWLDEFAARRQLVPDRPSYRDCEDQFIAYMAGRGNLPELQDDSLRALYRRMHDFNVEQCYCLTHRYMYATDLGQRELQNDWIGPALLIIIGKSALWKNFDLFFEAAFCALSTNPSRDEVLLIDNLSKLFLPQFKELTQGDIYECYHELFVYALFKLRRDRIRVSSELPDAGSGRVLTNFVESLGSKILHNVVRSLSEIQSIRPHAFYNELCMEKLAWLAATARSQTLFETEIRKSGRGLEPGAYDEYHRQVIEELEKLRSLTTVGAVADHCPGEAVGADRAASTCISAARVRPGRAERWATSFDRSDAAPTDY